jgi:hypothetical protein
MRARNAVQPPDATPDAAAGQWWGNPADAQQDSRKAGQPTVPNNGGMQTDFLDGLGDRAIRETKRRSSQ